VTTTTPEPVAAEIERWPSVSVVVPTRDRPELLAAAIEKIVGQDYPGSVECVIVFDQSPPSGAFAPDGATRTTKVITNTRTPGLAGARNSGIVNAGGALIAFCDDDDEWLDGKLRRQVELLQRRPDVGVVVTGVEIDYDGKAICRVPRAGDIDHKDLLRSRVMEAHPSSVLVRRHLLLDEIGLVDEMIPGSYAEDYEWLLRAARVTTIAAVPAALVKVRWHTASFFTARWKTISEALQYLVEKHPEFESEPVGLARIYGQLAFAHAGLREPRAALGWARRSLRLHWREPRPYLAALVSTRLVSADTVLRTAHRRGRGI
jgi:hypothetical protein